MASSSSSQELVSPNSGNILSRDLSPELPADSSSEEEMDLPLNKLSIEDSSSKSSPQFNVDNDALIAQIVSIMLILLGQLKGITPELSAAIRTLQCLLNARVQ